MGKNSENKTGLLNSFDLKNPKYKVLYGFMTAILVLFAVIDLFPIIWVILSSFKSSQELYQIPPTLWPTEFMFENIANAWKKSQIGTGFLNSLCIVGGCLASDIIINGIFGYVLSRIKPTGSKILDKMIFWSMLLPGISMVPLYITFVDVPLLHINLSGTFLPMWLMAGCNAFNVLMFRSFFNGIPMAYVEAAKIDGCSSIRIFLQIIMPLSKPIVMVMSIFQVMSSWSSFMWPYLMLGSTPLEPVAVKLYTASMGAGDLMANEVMMTAILSVLPLMIAFTIFSKRILGGLAIGGVKG